MQESQAFVMQIIIDEGENGEEIERIEVSEELQLSLSALKGHKGRKLCASSGKLQLQVLIDIGSTHNFLGAHVVKKLRCDVEPVSGVSVEVANGQNMRCHAKCASFKWQMQDHHFDAEVFILPLDNYDLILGVQWLETLAFIEYEDIFTKPKGLSPRRNHDHKIPLQVGASLVNIRPYNLGSLNKEMGEVKLEECCLENKQLAAASCSSISEGSVSTILKSPGVPSPATASPIHRRTTGPIRRAKGGWTLEEDETLRNAVAAFKGKSWKKIAEFFPDRSEVQCLHRWQKVLNPDLVKGPWTQEEDDKIIDLVAKYGPTKWSVIAKSLPGRIGKQCRERWHNHLNPDIKNGAWTLEEELALMNAHRIHGNKWAEIAKVFVWKVSTIA
ncbi:hypothetical protein GH714_014149 [Hevea brasiliensis]|uniref:Uncharacterized protein n=1 Tax=Hevea brasiliensis TaxID=3981 RepID=A0A6A6LRL3_HEVBR|nr:hypothetical protein GH714_014149 [Hevea brasiliensis]